MSSHRSVCLNVNVSDQELRGSTLMSERPVDLGEGLSVLDGVALIAGVAVASVHIRGLIEDELFGPGWIVVWLTFGWVCVTAAGPFVYVVRRYVRKPLEYPRVGDQLWGLLGLPWLLTAFFQNTPERGTSIQHTLVATGLSIGLMLVSALAVSVICTTWVLVTPDRASQTFSGPWTNRLGLVLAIAWPLQCGAGMVVVS